MNAPRLMCPDEQLKGSTTKTAESVFENHREGLCSTLDGWVSPSDQPERANV